MRFLRRSIQLPTENTRATLFFSCLSKKSAWPVTGFEKRGPLKVLKVLKVLNVLYVNWYLVDRYFFWVHSIIKGLYFIYCVKIRRGMELYQASASFLFNIPLIKKVVWNHFLFCDKYLCFKFGSKIVGQNKEN